MVQATICDIEGIHLDEVYDGIYVAGINSSYDDVLRTHGITHMISFYQKYGNVEDGYDYTSLGVKYNYFDVEDEAETNWEEVWEKIQGPINVFLDDEKEAREDRSANQPKLLFQCKFGLRRSALMACCFLIKYKNVPLLDAMKTVTQARTCMTNEQKNRRHLVSFYKSAGPLLEKLGGSQLQKEWFEADDRQDKESKDLYYLKGYKHIWKQANHDWTGRTRILFSKPRPEHKWLRGI